MNEIKYSLVVATFNRTKELDFLFESLTKQNLAKRYFELIVVDQNPSNLIENIILKYSGSLNIHHIKSDIKGLSYCRNLGINHAKGEYVCVPDDDCTYYPDTLQSLEDELKKLDYPDMLIGKVFNRENRTYVFKKTPLKMMKVNKSNFYPLVSSIVIFFKNNGFIFDENFGIGAQYPSNEDGDIILQYIEKNKKVIYSPEIECNHPPYNAANMNSEKLYNYGIGFGAMCRKYFSFTIGVLFLKVLFFQFLMSFKYLLLADTDNRKRRWKALLGRLYGFMNYS